MHWYPEVPGWAMRVSVEAKVALFGGFVWSNWRGAGRLLRSGLGLFGVGLVLNAVPSVIYGGMPYTVDSARRAGMSTSAVSSGRAGHVPVEEIPAALGPFADGLPVPQLHLVASVGDLFIVAGLTLAGLAIVVARFLRRPAERVRVAGP